MPYSVAQNSFVGGEWSPELYSRTDLAKYATAVRRMKNFYPHPHGPASNRPGKQFVAEIKDSTKQARLVPFQFSVIQSYMLEFGDQYMRVVKDQGLVVNSAGNGLDIVEAATYQWTASGSGTNEYYLELSGGGDPSISQPQFVYEDVGGANTTMPEGTLGSLAAGETAYGDNDGLGFSTIYVRLSDNVDPDTKADGYLEAGYYTEVVTPYLEADIPYLKFEQSADVVYIRHPSYAPRKLTRTDHDVWSLSVIAYGSSVDAPINLVMTGTAFDYVVTAIDADGVESVASASVNGDNGNTLTWDAVAEAQYYYVYKDGNKSGTFGWIGQADTNSFFVAAGGITPDYDRTPPTAFNPFNATDDYPAACVFFEQRLLELRTNNQPQGIWGSVVGDFENHNKSSPLRDDDAYNFIINSRQVNKIEWAVALDSLIIGTSGSEWRMQPGSAANTITPTSVDLKVQSRWGVSYVQPVIVGNTVLFLERSGDVVRDLVFSFEVDAYSGNDLSILSTHLFKDYKILEWSYAQSPSSIVWCIRNDGALLGLTYYREHQVWGWHQHETQGTYESVATITTESELDETYFIVKRNVNGQTKRYIEFLRERMPLNGNFRVDIRDAFFVDSGLTLDNPISITNITKANPAVVTTATAHGLSNGDSIDITEVLGMTEINPDLVVGELTHPGSVRYKVANVTSNTFELQSDLGVDIDSTGFINYLSGGKVRKAVTVLSGLDHLEGEEVIVLADGNVVSGLTVAGGSITLPNSASRVHVGLPYTCDLETMDFEYPIQSGNTVQDLIRDVDTAVFRLTETREMYYGTEEENLDEYIFRTTEPLGTPTQPFTGDVEVTPQKGPDREGRLFIRTVNPLPITVSAIIARMSNETL